MDQRGCYLSNLKIEVDNNLCDQHYFHKPNSVVKKLFYLLLKLNFHTYNSPILVNKPINKPIRNREIFWTSNDGPCYCYFEQVMMAHSHCQSPCLLLWCWCLWKGFHAAFDLSIGRVLVHQAIPIKCFISHRPTDPFFWKSTKKNSESLVKQVL